MNPVNPTNSVSIEKFDTAELNQLRAELQKSGLDSRQTAELISAFLACRGYGVASDDLRSATVPIDLFASSIQRMQEELEKVAYFM